MKLNTPISVGLTDLGSVGRDAVPAQASSALPDKDEKARRKQILHEVRDQQRQKIRDAFPVSVLVLKSPSTSLTRSSPDDIDGPAEAVLVQLKLTAEAAIEKASKYRETIRSYQDLVSRQKGSVLTTG